jgi:AcrR family transcriptional regulator
VSDKRHTKRVNERPRTEPRTRSEQKKETRQALLDAALEVLQTTSFDNLRLRKVARVAGVSPGAFYRHFADLDELGVALVEESFRTLRGMIREGLKDVAAAGYAHVIRTSAEVLVRHIRANRAHFGYVARNRFSGSTSVRTAIRSEIKLFASELATDLARFPGLDTWSTEDLQLLASLLVDTSVSAVEEILSLPEELPDGEDAAIRWVERRLLMIALGAGVWRGG